MHCPGAFITEITVILSGTVAWWVRHLPRTTEDVGSIPGTGRYIVAQVCSLGGLACWKLKLNCRLVDLCELGIYSQSIICLGLNCTRDRCLQFFQLWSFLFNEAINVFMLNYVMKHSKSLFCSCISHAKCRWKDQIDSHLTISKPVELAPPCLFTAKQV